MQARIFHVEDGVAYARELHERLADAGHVVVLHVATVAEALTLIPDRLVAESVNLAILDRDLPDGSGALVATALRDSTIDVPIIANSGYETTFGDYNVTKLQRVRLLETVGEALAARQEDPPPGR